MLPERLLKEKLWLQLATLSLVVAWSLPVVAQGLYAESHLTFSLVFALVWSGLIAVGGLLFYSMARSNRQFASAGIVLALATVILLYRVPESFVQPEFTAEDATIFFAQQRELGWWAFLTTSAGYYHTLVRLVAEACSIVPTLFIPAFYNLAWLGIYSVVTAYLLVQFPNRKLAPIFVLTSALVPHSSEVFMTLTNAIWIVGMGLTAFVLLPVPNLRVEFRYVIALVLLMFSLTGPFGIVLVPFYFLRWISDRKSFPLVYFFAVLAGALVQLASLHSIHAVQPDGQSHDLSPLATFLLGLEIAVIRIPWALMAAYQPFEPYWLLGLIITIVVLGYVGRELIADFESHLFPAGCLLLCAIYLLLSLLRVTSLVDLIPFANGDRYFYIPKILFVWAMIDLASTARNPRPFLAVLFFCAMSSMVNLSSRQTVADNHWPHYSTLIDQGQSVLLPLNPPGWNAPIK